MNKVAITYWNNPQTTRTSAASRLKTAKRSEKVTPQWFIFAVTASMTLMLCMAINLRAYSAMNVEAEQNERLNVTIEQLTNENLAIQEEIHNLKTDASFIEREARKIGMARPNKKILVPVD
ncbi:MAG: septum formation initiator family protein [Acidobacteriota bacterium]|nr:septum formation initiator family protein [Acidobacteriota bacterium]